MEWPFTPDGKTLVSGGQNNGYVWDVTTGKARFPVDARMIGRSMALSRDGATTAIGCAGSVVKLWNVATGKELFTEFEGHDSEVNCLAFSPDGKTLASGEFYERIRLWDAANWKTNRVLKDYAGSLSFTPDSARFASASRRNEVHIWEPGSGKQTMSIKVPDADDVRSVVFSADGSKLITLDKKHNDKGQSAWGPHLLRHWNAATGKLERSWTVPGQMYQPVVAPEGLRVLAGAGDAIRLHDVRIGRDQLFRGSGQPLQQTRTLAVSPDGRLLASGDSSTDFPLRLWEIATGKEIQVLKGHECAVTVAAWSPDGRILASADNNRNYGSEKAVNTVRLWNAINGRELARFDGLSAVVACLAFSPDGVYLAGGMHDSTILVWDLRPPTRAAKLAARPVEPIELEACLADLAADDARKAHQASWKLIAGSGQSVPYLREQLRPVAAADGAKIRQWIADLDSDKFAVRQAAAKELEKTGEQIRAHIQKAMEGNVALETRRRLVQVLDALPDIPGPPALRTIRAIAVLEKIGTPDARDVLETLSRGAPGARETEAAKASLQHLRTRAFQIR